MRAIPTQGATVSRADDGHDFDAFYTAELARLFRAMVLVCGDPAEADDVSQEAFISVFERWDHVSVMERPFASRSPRCNAFLLVKPRSFGTAASAERLLREWKARLFRRVGGGCYADGLSSGSTDEQQAVEERGLA
jgi:hypothetical protein